MRSDQSLGDLKNGVFWKKKQLSNRIKFFKQKIIIWRKIALNVNEIIPNMTCSLKTLNLENSSKNTKFKKIFTTHISLRWIYRSAKIDWTKKPIWVCSSFPHKWGRNNKKGFCGMNETSNNTYWLKIVMLITLATRFFICIIYLYKLFLIYHLVLVVVSYWRMRSTHLLEN